MAREGIAPKLIECDHMSPYRVQMDVAYKLKKILLLFADDRFVPVLKEMTLLRAGMAITILFLGGILLAQSLGLWTSELSIGDYQTWLPDIRQLQHY